MSIKIGINGFGRIGRVIFRAAEKRKNIKIVAINDLLEIKHIAYMLKYDSTHGPFNGDIQIKNNNLIINGKVIRYTSQKNISDLKWNEISSDIIIEASGKFLTHKTLYEHINAGAKKIILTAPSQDNNIPMFVMGVNHTTYQQHQNIISNASCTTNCLAPLVKVINDNFGIIEGLMTTVHATTSSQNIIDNPSIKDWRLGRGALQNIIPSTTGAAKAIYKIIPELHGKLTGIAFRVPIANVSVVDLTVRLKNNVTYKEICQAIYYSANNELKGILHYTEDNVVSTDFNGNTCTSIFDAKAGIALNDNFVKLIAWYDNETGYSNKVLDLIQYVMSKNTKIN